MQRLFVFETSIGPFFIERSSSGSFHAVYRDENLGTYARPEEAVQDLAGGHTYPVLSGEDTSKLGIPAELLRWTRCE
jgi:hypothetical protein